MKLFLILSVVGLLSFNAFAQNPAKDDDALRSLLIQMITAQTEYDVKKLDEIFTSDYIEISPVGEFDERAKVLGFYKPEMKPDPANMSATAEQTEFSIRNYGKFAIVISRVNFNIVNEGKTLPPRSMRLMAVCRKENGSWKIASVQYTGIRPSAPKGS